MSSAGPNDGGPQRAGGKPGERVIPFGKYLLLDRLAVGGMAEVYTAKSFGVEGFEKIIAIKRILPTMAEDEDFIQMFIDEAKIAGHLNHANIAPIYELGKIGDSHYIALEYVWGKDLLQIMNRFRKMRRQMPPSMGAWIGSKMCEGLDYAHRKKDRSGKPLGIIHRDVSPENCLVSYEGQVKMIDFGIAKAASRNTKTQAGVLKGKFGYMSPEQVRGNFVDHRSDVFAVGTCVYEMLTSERLFVGESDFSTLEKVRHAQVPPLSQTIPDIPKELDEIVMKALTKEPDDRWQSAGEMQEALQRFIAKERPPFGTSKLSAWMKTAFAAEITKEKGRLDSFAKVGPPPTVPPPPPKKPPPPPPKRPAADDDEPAELTGEATMISSSPFEAMLEQQAAAEAAGDGGDDLMGQPTQIFFSADDLDEAPAAPAQPLGAVSIAPAHAVGSPSVVADAGPMRAQPAAGVEVHPGAMAAPQGGFAGVPQGGFAGAPQGGFAGAPGGFAGAPQGGFAGAPGGFAGAPQGGPGAPGYAGPGPGAFPAGAFPGAPGGYPPPSGGRSGETVELRAPQVAPTPAAKSRAPVIAAVSGVLALVAVAALAFFALRGDPVGTIEIHTVPETANADVVVDGTARGRAPLRLDNVPVGEHALIVQAVGFAPVQRTVTVNENGTAMLDLVLTPSAGVAGPAVAAAPVAAPVPVAPVPAVPVPAVPTAVAVAPPVAAPAAVAPPAAAVAAVAPVVAAPAPAVAAPAPAAAAPTPAPTRAAPAPAAASTPPAAAPARSPVLPTRSSGAATSAPRAEAPAAEAPAAGGGGPRRLPREAAPAAEAPAARGGRGTLMIQTLPWARVFLDGRDTGRNTPVRELSVTAGSHRLGLRTTDGTMHEETITVGEGETLRIVRQL